MGLREIKAMLPNKEFNEVVGKAIERFKYKPNSSELVLSYMMGYISNRNE